MCAGFLPLAALLLALAGPALAAWESPEYCPASTLPGHGEETATVSHVVDGDTLVLTDRRRVRLIGINAPELGHDGAAHEPYAVEALELLRSMLAENTRVTLHFGAQRKDRHGRSLAYVFLADGQNVGARLLVSGLAAAIVVPPNVAHAACYLALEYRARETNQGVWARLYRPVAVDTFPSGLDGFRLIRGHITRVAEGRHAQWLNFSGPRRDGIHHRVAVRISHRDLQYFTDRPSKDWVGKDIEVRGWLYRTTSAGHPQAVMPLRHPAMMRLLTVE